MEKSFAEMNYYEMLNVKPDVAFFEIRHAYNAALQMYQADSMISHSFFSQEERKQILSFVEKAYLTLINEKGKAMTTNLSGRAFSPPQNGKCPIKNRPVFLT